ncbi:isocitrate lyase/PEP mutase family protein [Psychrobacillus lasiicapitis]|uniref:Isocitrate lyase/phosphoenolpyruvate mutase family protein n=1 Tax=Psychrobacillus lasiicapitis TaxID=1636719 RepID=A0A544T6T9_9BACI|nr:isocitrate lyase/phosphoenolpyruvate mutase family protein [Psychrobacillus lasiicapitis]TQR13151.1 isocitrate lyase/phosphoenolpyruvate mutase family protein [Psychrobacillus lasiicapitis]GGA34057.1 carboxyvinyl-carboxyphosphonate phosphorylmutase [Psychrobacillus lasiicapitis]
MNKIERFNKLHQSTEPLFLGNAWDLLSALTLEKAGFQAIGTTSWGVANSLGLKDGELIDFDRHLQIIQTITEHVTIPVSADIESGYGESIEAIVHNVLKTADIGVAGINIEDSFKTLNGLRDISLHAKLLFEMRNALEHSGFKDFFINARTDTYLQKENPLLETIERGKAYVDSGASGIFVPGVTSDEDIAEISSKIKAPLNVLSLPGLTSCNKLKELGVRRFSFGNALSDKIIAFMEMNTAQLFALKDTAHLYEE